MPNSSEFEKLFPGSARNPFLRWMGIELLDAGEGWVRMKMPFRTDFLQPYTVHGGAIYSLADTAATHSLMTIIFPQELATTVEQRINFLKAVREGDIYCEARVLHLGKTLCYTEATLTQADQTLVAKSAATQMRLDPSRWAKK
jgi:1,4-dihydroxy-2-naphthoyl-CoA hydrolase